MLQNLLMVDESSDWELIGFVKRSDYRKKILGSLEKPLIPKEIAEETDIHQSNVSRALGDLREKELVQVMNPDAKTGRVYTLTEKGEKILKQI